MINRHAVLVRRALFVSFNVVLAAAIYLLIISPVYALFSAQTNALKNLHHQIARVEALLGQEEAVEKLVGDFNAHWQATAFWVGKNEGIASASLQAKLKLLSEQAGSHVQSIQGTEQRVMNNMRFIGAHIALSGTNAALYTLLEAIERHSPPLFVSSLTIRAPATTPGMVQAQETELNAQIEIIGAFNATPEAN